MDKMHGKGRMGYFAGADREIDLKDNHILEAKVPKRDKRGEYECSDLDLNQLIGNKDGEFAWDGTNYSGSAKDLRVDGYGESLRMHGSLRNRNAQYVPADFRLGERVSIRNSKLQYSDGH